LSDQYGFFIDKPFSAADFLDKQDLGVFGVLILYLVLE